jgi:hypothetical protein
VKTGPQHFLDVLRKLNLYDLTDTVSGFSVDIGFPYVRLVFHGYFGLSETVSVIQQYKATHQGLPAQEQNRPLPALRHLLLSS